MTEPAPEPESALPDGVLALTILISGGVAAGISSLAVNPGMREIYDSMGVELPGLLQLAMKVNAPVLCGLGGAFGALVVYLVASRRITGAGPSRIARVGATLVACALLAFAVLARESMQFSIEGMREALSQGGPVLPAPVPGEAQALVREVVQAVEAGLASSKDEKWTFRRPGGTSQELALPPLAAPGGISFPLAPGEGDYFAQIQAAPAPSGAELGYAFTLWREAEGVYRLRIWVFRGPPWEGGYRAAAQFETVLR